MEGKSIFEDFPRFKGHPVYGLNDGYFSDLPYDRTGRKVERGTCGFHCTYYFCEERHELMMLVEDKGGESWESVPHTDGDDFTEAGEAAHDQLLQAAYQFTAYLSNWRPNATYRRGLLHYREGSPYFCKLEKMPASRF